MAQGATVKKKKKSKSVLKNARQTVRRAMVNRINRTRVRTAMRRLRAALTAGDVAAIAITPRHFLHSHPTCSSSGCMCCGALTNRR